MAASSTPRLVAFKAGADLSAKAYTFVKFGSADDTVVSSGAGEATDGIMQGLGGTLGVGGASGSYVEVALQGGGAKLKLGGTVTRGQFLKSDANGAGVAVAADKDVYGAKAMASGVSGDIIPVEVMSGNASI